MDWIIWLGAAVVLAIAELVSLDLILLMLAVGCLAGVIVAIPTDSWIAEALAAILVSGAALAVLRPQLVHRLRQGPEVRIGPARLVGQQTSADAEISAQHPAQVIIAGEQWTAQPYDESMVIAPGSVVEVLVIKGATAYVHPL